MYANNKKDPLLFAYKGPICTIYKLYEPADLGLRNEWIFSLGTAKSQLFVEDKAYLMY